MALAWIKMKVTAKGGRDITLPAELTHRSINGDTLFLIPGHSYELTKEELAFIKSDHKDMLKDMIILREAS